MTEARELPIMLRRLSVRLTDHVRSTTADARHCRLVHGVPRLSIPSALRRIASESTEYLANAHSAQTGGTSCERCLGLPVRLFTGSGCRISTPNIDDENCCLCL